jgi:hypothetical protein
MVKLIHREMDLSLKIRKMENDENFNSFEWSFNIWFISRLVLIDFDSIDYLQKSIFLYLSHSLSIFLYHFTLFFL